MGILSELQQWYTAQCNGEWEHGKGIAIVTFDNPGWGVDINLAGTALENRQFKKIESKDYKENDTDWYICYVEDKKFKGRGDPAKLEKLLSIFLEWAKS